MYNVQTTGAGGRTLLPTTEMAEFTQSQMDHCVYRTTGAGRTQSSVNLLMSENVPTEMAEFTQCQGNGLGEQPAGRGERSVQDDI